MKRFNIYDMGRGVDYGTHEGQDRDAALDAMARSRGFENFAAAEPHIGKPLVVTQVYGGKDFVPMDERAAANQATSGEAPSQFGSTELQAMIVAHATAPALAAPAAKAEPVAAWLCTDLDGHGDVAFTKEEAKRRAGEFCDHYYPLVEPVAAQADDVRDAERWRFMMQIADNPEGPEAQAMERFGNEMMEEDRPESEQMNELADRAMAYLRTTSAAPADKEGK